MKFPWTALGALAWWLVGMQLSALAQNAETVCTVVAPSDGSLSAASETSPLRMTLPEPRKWIERKHPSPKPPAAQPNPEAETFTLMPPPRETDLLLALPPLASDGPMFVVLPRTRLEFENAFGVKRHYANPTREALNQADYAVNEFIFVVCDSAFDLRDRIEAAVNDALFSPWRSSSSSDFEWPKFTVDLATNGIGFHFDVPFPFGR